MACADIHKPLRALMMFLVSCLITTGGCQSITSGPIETVSFVGYPSQMNCTISEYTVWSAWGHQDETGNFIEVTIGEQIQNNSYNVTTNQINGEYVYNLFMENVATFMNTVHRCNILITSAEEEAMLHVLDGGPVCGLTSPSFVVAEEETPFNCSVENGVPPGELVWYADGNDKNREGSSLSNVWYPTFQREDNGTTVNCYLEHESILPSAEEAANCGEDILIVVQYPPTVNITNATRNVVFEGEQFVAECKVDEVGYPPDIREWYWRGPRNEIYDANILVLENITREHGGNYSCIASNEYADGRVGEGSTSLRVEVQYAPSLAVYVRGNVSENGTAIEGESFAVECIVIDSNPQPHSISWFDWTGTNVSSDEWLVFNSVKRHEAGNYTCKATNTFWDKTTGNAIAQFSIHVQYIPSVNVTITGDASQTGRVIEGHSFVAECVVLDSDPTHDNVTWVDSESNLVSLEELMKFENVKREQSDAYMCVANNVFWNGRIGSGTAVINVDVEYLPIATVNDKSDGMAVEGREYKADCSAIANPEPRFSWSNESGDEIHTGSSLYLSDIKREESGMTYTCIATNTFWDDSKGQGNDSITLDVQYNPDIELRDYGLFESSKIIEDDDFSVLCLADSNPEADSIAWDDSIADGAWLNFTSVERNQHGDYICTANNTFWDNSTGTGNERISIDVQYPPSVNKHTVFCVEHDLDVRLSCDVNSNPSPSFYTWARNGDILSREQTYVINRANRSDSGNYNCTATNVFYDETNATGSGVTELIVQYLSVVTMTTTPLHNITEGSDVTIYCQAVNGNPNPYKINLTFEGETIAESNGSALYHNLTGISRAQDGSYQCNAMTQFRDQREDLSTNEMQIIVFYSARISSEESRVYEASVGDDVSMECTAEGNPSPTIRWFDNRNETLSNDDDNVRIENAEAGEITSTLTVTLGSNSFGTYVCEAYNWVKPSHYQSMTINETGTGESNLTIIIIASACAGFLFLLLLIAIAVCLCRKTTKQDHKSISQSVIWTSTYDGVQLDSDFDRHDPDGLSNESDTMLSGEPLTFFANTDAEQSVSTDKTEKLDSDQDKVAENKEMTSDTPTMTRDSVSFLSFLPMPNMDGDIANQPTESASSGQDSQKQQGEEQAVNPPQDNDGGQIPVPPPLVTAEVNDLSKTGTVKTGDVMTYADLDLPIPSPQVPLPPKEETQYADLQFAQN